jgi:hypothetical protein
LSPLKGVMISNSLLQVAIKMVHKLRINCGMMLGMMSNVSVFGFLCATTFRSSAGKAALNEGCH